MADEFDQAQLREESDRQHALSRVLAARHKMNGPGRNDCEDCGEEIPKARREIVPGAPRCVSCQTAFERGVGT